jgi:hypothetical protein
MNNKKLWIAAIFSVLCGCHNADGIYESVNSESSDKIADTESGASKSETEGESDTGLDDTATDSGPKKPPKEHGPGDLNWVNTYATPSFDVGFAITTAKDGSTYITGRSNDCYNFIAKIDPYSGDVIWKDEVISYGQIDRGTNVITLADGSVVFGGLYSFEMTFAPGTDKETTLKTWSELVLGKDPNDMDYTGRDNRQLFFAKYSADGEFEWAKAIMGPSSNFMYSQRMAALSDGSFLIYGETPFDMICLDFDYETKKCKWRIPDYMGTSWIAKYGPDGSPIRTIGFHAPWPERTFPGKIAVLEDDSFIVTGAFNGELLEIYAASHYTNARSIKKVQISDPNDSFFIAKFPADMTTVLWNVTNVTVGVDGISTTDDGGFYLTGETKVVVDDNINYDGHISKYNPNGELLWTKVLGTGTLSNIDYWRVTPYTILTLPDGSTVVGGEFANKVVF